MKELLQIRDLCIGFLVQKKPVHIINHLTLDIYQNEVLSIIGETGCGKSVTGSAVLHLLPDNAIASGDIFYNGQDILHRSDSAYRGLRGSEIMSVPQSPSTSLNPLMRVGTQVSECILGKKHSKENTKASVRSNVMQIFRKLKFPRGDSVYDNYPCELSGGMCQRVLISMGVITHPNLLVIDEPTKAIDWALRKDVLEILSSLKQERNCAMMLITHDIPLSRRLADRVAVMYAGEIVEVGTTADVLEHPRHPYTQGLIASTPAYGFQTMKGFMPAFTDLPAGCRFSPRCPYATEACRTTVPHDITLEHNHVVKCIRSTELSDIGG
ncbi:MAG: ABC transporter ATP-binding protein [Oscillospiraceae bacterium]|jgi:peptide/nickel transport system ATP-binding protein